MRLSNIRKSFMEDKGRFFRVIAILAICFIINLTVELSSDLKGAILYDRLWLSLLTFFNAFISLSIFLISFFTYPHDKKHRILAAGSTFLAVGLLDLFNLFGIMLFFNGVHAQQWTFLTWVIADIISLIGFIVIIILEDAKEIGLKRRLPVLISLGLAAIAWAVVINIPSGILFVDPKGPSIWGSILIWVIFVCCIVLIYLSLRKLIKTKDKFYGILTYSILFMLFSGISLLNIGEIHDLRSIISLFYRLISCSVLFNALYIQGLKKPYILLEKTREELNGYVAELDMLVDKRTTELRNINEKLMADQEIARGMQLSMLPTTMPRNEYVAFSAGYLPAEKLSGDFYNVFKIDNTRFGVCIGDVSGHGVSAAMLSIFTFQKIQSLMEEEGGEGMAIPSLVLKHLYDSFNTANFNEDMYIVMLYGVFDYSTGIFSYASGGLNTTPLRVRPDGSIQELDNDGFAICKLGSLLKPKFVNHQILLFPGDKLILYTDGLIDARNSDNQEYSVKRLKKAILRHYRWGPDYLTDAIIRDVKNFTGEKPADDVTLLAIDVLLPF